MKLDYKLSSVFGLLLLATCILALGWFAQSKSFQTLQIRGVEYVGVQTAGQGEVAPRMTGPVSVKEIKHSLELLSLDISFEFLTHEPTFSYGNLFQTGDSINAVRMELQPSSNLVLVLGDGKLFTLSKAIQLDKFHAVRLKYERNQFFKVFIDDTEVLNITDQGLLAGKFDISNIVVGTGLAKQRTLSGAVKHFNLDAAYSYASFIASLSRWMLIFLCGIVFLKSLPITKITGANGSSPLVISNLADNTAVYGFTIGLVALGLLSINFFGEQHLGLSKWIAHLTLPVSLVAILFIMKRHEGLWKWTRWPLGSIFIAYVAYILIATSHKTVTYDASILGILLFSLLGFVLSFTKIRLGLSISRLRLASAVAIGAGIFFLALSWSTLFDLTNWQAFKQMFDSNFAVSVVGAFLVLRAVFAVIFELPDITEISDLNLCVQEKAKSLLSRVYLDVAVIAVFFWISFRQDTLFIPGSEYHWEYFVGTVQGVTNGGWLLWDTPSQYGFLNILLASLVPSASAWQSFYIFQGTLLFLVSTGIYLAARRYTSTSVFQRLTVFAIVFMALFFADPELIGPSPFPSSSVVRFFCVYALVLTPWFIPKFGLRQAIALSIVWSLAVIWSAESAIYGTAIFLFILVALLQTRTTENHRFTLAGKYVVIAAMCLAMVFVVMFAYYFARLGVAPDLFGFFEHAVRYAGGFGYVPFSLNGPGNLLLLVFMGISILCIGAIRRGGDANEIMVAPLAAMAGCIWGISTYYIGRPVPQNITAMLPLIAIVVYLTLMLTKRMNQGASYALPIKAAALPLFFLILIPVFNLKWIGNLAQIQSFSSDITTKLPKASDELQQLLLRAEAPPDTPIVYYGDDAAPPILSGDYAKLNGMNWLPTPLQLLETPVSEARRNLYLNRYICRNQPRDGILVNRKSDAIQIRLQVFLQELRHYYDIKEVASGNTYTLYRFSKMDLNYCQTKVGKKTS